MTMTLCRRRGLVKPSFMAPPEPLDKSLAKTLVADSDSDSEPEVSGQSEAGTGEY